MADPLSALSAGAGFISLAGLLGEGMIKFHSIFRDVRYAQDEINELTNSVQSFCGLLRSVGEQLHQDPFDFLPEKAALDDCLRLCEHTTTEMHQTLTTLSEDFRRHKAYKMKMPFKKEQLRDSSHRVDRSAYVLGAAFQSFSVAVGRHQQKRLESGIQQVYNELRGLSVEGRANQTNLQQRIEAMREEIKRQLDHTDTRLASLPSPDSTSPNFECAGTLFPLLKRRSTLRSLAAAVTENGPASSKLQISSWPAELIYDKPASYERTEIAQALKSKRCRRKTTKLLSIPIPFSIFERHYRLSLDQAASGLTFTLRTEIIVERPTPFMKACFEGDLDKVQAIWTSTPPDEQRGILFVQKKDGRTCLHNAVKSGNRELVRFLLDLGAGERLDSQGKTRLILSASSAKFAKNTCPPRYMTTVLEFQQEVRRAIDIDDEDLDFNDPEKHERELIIHDLMLRHATWTLEDRLKVFLLLNSGPPEFSSGLEELLRSFELDPYDPFVLSTTIDSAMGLPNIFHLIAKAFSKMVHHRIDLRQLKELTVRAVEAGVDLHAVHPERMGRNCCRKRYWTTPLANMFLDSMHLSKMTCEESKRRQHLPVLDRPFERWMAFLSQAKVDVAKYAERELQMLKSARIVWEANRDLRKPRRKGSDGPGFWHDWFEDLDGFAHDPESKKWKLIYKAKKVFVDDLYAKEFWDVVNPPIIEQDMKSAGVALQLPGSFPELENIG